MGEGDALWAEFDAALNDRLLQVIGHRLGREVAPDENLWDLFEELMPKLNDDQQRGLVALVEGIAARHRAGDDSED